MPRFWPTLARWAYATNHRRLTATYAAALLIVVAIGLVSWGAGIPASDLTKDPTQVADVPPYVGVLSNLGVVLWSAAATLALLAGLLLKEREPELARFLLGASLLSAVLLLDDLFLLHETFEDHTLAGAEILPIAVYGAIAVALLARHRTLVLARTPVVILLVATAALATSLLIDLAPGELASGQYLVEDGAKFLGIVSWTLYLGVTAYASLAPT